MLIVVEHRNLHARLELRLDLETLGALDILKIDAAECRLQRRHGLDHALDGVGGDFDVEYVDAGELLEQNRLALHHRLRCQRADIAEAEHGGAVGDNSNKIGADRQRCRLRRIGGNRRAGGRHAGRISEREVALVGERLDRLNLKLARPWQPMISECRGMKVFRIGRHTYSRVSDPKLLSLIGPEEVSFPADCAGCEARATAWMQHLTAYPSTVG